MAPDFTKLCRKPLEFTWVDPVSANGLGFVILTYFNHTVCAGCLAALANSSLKAKAKVMLATLHECFKRSMKADLILLDN